MAELKKCPFCGGETVSESCGNYWVKCIKCGSRGPVKNTKEEAITNWNNRVTEAEIRAKVIDDFAERLKQRVSRHYVDCDAYFGGIAEEILYADYIDEIAEEMRGEKCQRKS